MITEKTVTVKRDLDRDGMEGYEYENHGESGGI